MPLYKWLHISYMHKLSRRIINENQVVVLEDLAVSDMLAKTKPDDRDEPRWKERRRHRDIVDCGFYSLVQKLMYKAVWYGREVVKVSRWFPSSQLCNKCGWRNKDLKPTDREWVGIVGRTTSEITTRLLDEGLRIRTLGTRGIAACPDVRPAMSGLLVEAEAATL